jgi:hypothetical protein
VGRARDGKGLIEERHITETASGALMLTGCHTPVAAAMITGTMVTAEARSQRSALIVIFFRLPMFRRPWRKAIKPPFTP